MIPDPRRRRDLPRRPMQGRVKDKPVKLATGIPRGPQAGTADMASLELDGTWFRLNPAAISVIRYRATYGESAVKRLSEHLTEREEERLLLRLVHTMIPPEERPPLKDLAQKARRDTKFVPKAREAAKALLARDPCAVPPEESDLGFDEYGLLASMTLGGVDGRLLYELPIMHLATVLDRCAVLRDPKRKVYHPMSKTDRAALYPRRRRKGRSCG